MGATKEVLVPDIGDFKNVPVIEVLVRPGDVVNPEDPLVTLESDKATMDVPAPFRGTVKDLTVNVGDKVSTGSPILVLEAEDAPRGGNSAPAKTSVPAASVAPAVPSAAPVDQTPQVPSAPVLTRESSVARKGQPPHASPAIRRFARELGVDLYLVGGSGPNGRILKEDVQSFVKAALASPAPAEAPSSAVAAVGGINLLPWPQVDFGNFGVIERRALSRIQKISGANLHRNWVMIPHVTHFDEADITALEAFRRETGDATAKQGIKVTLLPFLLKASVAALKRYPVFNASLDGDELVLKRYYHLGFAADTPNGLVVPVIRDVDQKGVLQIAREIGELSASARDGKLKPADMQGGTFSVSSLGGIGGTGFTPIINAPEVAILGVTRSTRRQVERDGRWVPRLMLPLALSYDHRVIDGAAAARFVGYLAAVLADLRRAVL